jgi:hypothetical protein
MINLLVKTYKVTGLVDYKPLFYFYELLLLSGMVLSWFIPFFKTYQTLAIWTIYYSVMIVMYYFVRPKFSFLLQAYNVTNNSNSSTSCASSTQASPVSQVPPVLHKQISLQFDEQCIFDYTIVTNEALTHLNPYKFYFIYGSFFLYSLYAFVFTLFQWADPTVVWTSYWWVAGRVIVGLSWCYFFMLAGCIFIYIQAVCDILDRRVTKWISTDMSSFCRPTNEDTSEDMNRKMNWFYHQYERFFEECWTFTEGWKSYILIALIFISFRIPLSIAYIFYEQNLYEVPTLLFQSTNWLLLMHSISSLNEKPKMLLKELYTNRIFSNEIMEGILVYTKYKKLGMSIYGIRPTFEIITKLTIFMVNLVLPVLLATLSMIFKK